MLPATIQRIRGWLPRLAVCGILIYAVTPSLIHSQPPADKAPAPSSYDQVSPVLLGQESFDAMLRRDKADKPNVMARQKRLLDERYDLTPRVDARVTMTRGKAIPVGPTAKLPPGMTWDKLTSISPDEIREHNAFPKGYLPLPHPHHEVGGMIFPQAEIKLLSRLERHGVAAVTNAVPGGPRQVFIEDPNGVRVEINVRS